MRLSPNLKTGLTAAMLLGASLLQTVQAEDAPVVSSTNNAEVIGGTWQHHKAEFTYFGITSLYSCYGLEDNLKRILIHLGARKDAKVSARGCSDGPDRPSRSAWVSAEFDTLVPVSESGAPDAVPAQWLEREISPRRPYFMDDGDCELIEQIKDLISKNFNLRDLDYRTSCIPRSISINGFNIRAQALIAVVPPKAANTRGPSP